MIPAEQTELRDVRFQGWINMTRKILSSDPPTPTKREYYAYRTNCLAASYRYDYAVRKRFAIVPVAISCPVTVLHSTDWQYWARPNGQPIEMK